MVKIYNRINNKNKANLIQNSLENKIVKPNYVCLPVSESTIHNVFNWFPWKMVPLNPQNLIKGNML